LVRVTLDITLDAEVVTDEAWRKVAFDLIDTLDRKVQAIELIRAVREARPLDTALIAFCDPLLAQANGPSPPSADALRKAVAAFSNRFQERIALFKYLNAYKGLHDVLHHLQSFHSRIAAAVAERKADPSRPLEGDVVIWFGDHVKMASKCVRDIEFPDNPPAWVAKFVTAAKVLCGSDVESMDHQLDRLKGLPAVCLALLNQELVLNARRLTHTQLTSALDGILIALVADGNPETANLRVEVEHFRGLYSELGDLVKAHNLCQTISNALLEVTEPTSVAPGDLSDWDEAKKSLDELSSQRKDDMRVSRTYEAAKLFEAAKQSQAFQTFTALFDDLFTKTDTALLDVTISLTRDAMPLHNALENLQ
jgi:hypothetical protein